MTGNLTPQLEELEQSKVASGVATSNSDALCLTDRQDRLRAAKLEHSRDDIRKGLASGASQTWSAQEAKREARARKARRPA